MSFRVVDVEVKPLTRELAEKIANMEASPTERFPSERRIRFLYEKLKNGHLLPVSWAIAKLGRKEYRVNGQHSSQMLARLSEEEFPEDMTATITHISVTDMFGLVEVFRQYDPKESARTSADVAHAFQGVCADRDIKQIPADIAKLAVDGAAWHRRKVLKVDLKGDDRYSIFCEDNEGTRAYVKWVNSLLDENEDAPAFRRLGVVAAMYGTFLKDHERDKVRRFWDAVAAGAGEDDEPAVMLNAWLSDLVERRQKATQMQIYDACSQMWNAYVKNRRGVEIRLRRRIPLRILEVGEEAQAA